MIEKGTTQFYSRLVFGTLLTIIVFLAIFLSHAGGWAWAFAAIVASGVILAQWEYYQMAQAKGHQPFVGLGLGTSFAYLLALFITSRYPGLGPFPQAVLLCSLMVFFIVSFLPRPDPLVNVALTLFGVGYLALPLGAIILIAYLPLEGQDNRWWLLYLYAVTKMTDVGALAIGKTYGKRPLALHISPNKTVEGALGGFGSALLVSLLFVLLAKGSHGLVPVHLSLWQGFWLGAAIGIISQLGDLSESVLKRDAKVKDSSRLPGLGGVLDIMDSLVFTAPFLLFFLEWTV